MSKQNTLHEITISNTEFTQIHSVKFPFTATKINIMNDSQTEMFYSFNGRDIDGHILFDDESHNLSDVSVSRIWFKTPTPDAEIRIIAWAVV